MSIPLPRRPRNLAELSDKEKLLVELTSLADRTNPLPDTKDLRFMVVLHWFAWIFIVSGLVFIIFLAPRAEGFAETANAIAVGVTISGLGFAFMAIALATAESISEGKRFKATDARIMHALTVVSEQVSAMHDALDQSRETDCRRGEPVAHVANACPPKEGHLARFVVNARRLTTRLGRHVRGRQ